MTPWPITTPRWPNPWNLSPQQERVVHLYAKGLNRQAIAEQTHTKISTIDTHLAEIRRKMAAPSAARCAVLYALWRREMLGPSAEIQALMAHAPEDRGGTPAVERRGALDAGLGG